MKTLKIMLTPIEPYFFGNEKSFTYDEQNTQQSGGYYISSNLTPSQTTLFGTLRYLGIKEKKTDYSLSEEDKSNIGSHSFRINDDKALYGKIDHISPLYIQEGTQGNTGDYLIKTPRDHMFNDKNKQINDSYSPFCPDNYIAIETVINGKLVTYKRVPVDYNAKEYNPDSYMTQNGRIVSSDCIYKRITRVGINRSMSTDALFKREFINMDKHSFVFFATVADDFPDIVDHTVFLGQCKSPFSVYVSESVEPDFSATFVKNLLIGKVRYALSDIYITCELHKLYEACEFAAVGTRTFRGFETNYKQNSTQKNRFNKSSHLNKLFESGSIFIMHNATAFDDLIALAGKQPKIVGFNNFIKH